MQTYLLITANQKEANKEILKFKKKLDISDFDINIIEPDPSISIADIRNITHTVSRKAVAGQNRLMVIKGMDSATNEAQNALLKLLEEPQKNLYLILIAQSTDKLLPTVQSRCQIIKITETGKTKKTAILAEILMLSPGEKLLFLSKKISDRETAEKFIQNIINELEDQLKENTNQMPTGQISDMLGKAIKAKNMMDGNVNYKLILDVLFLGFPQFNSIDSS